MKKKCGNSGFFSDTNTSHGVVIAKKSSSPEPICSVFTCDIAAQKKLDARTTAAENPARGPNTLRPAWETSAMPNSPHKPVHSRAYHSPRPNSVKVSAFIQVCSGGFSKYLMPFKRVVIQSLLVFFSRVFSAFRLSSVGSC